MKRDHDELESLNIDALDIEELERRLELSEGLIAAADSCYGYSGCGCNCQANICRTDTNCT